MYLCAQKICVEGIRLFHGAGKRALRRSIVASMFAIALTATSVLAAVIGETDERNLNYYPNASINRFDKYAGELFSESVDPHKGGLSLKVRPIYVPGPGGMDIAVNLTYRAPDPTYMALTVRESFIPFYYGVGWGINFYRVSGGIGCPGLTPETGPLTYYADAMPVLHHPDGMSETMYYNFPPGAGAGGITSGGGVYTTRSGWRLNCGVAPQVLYGPNGLIVKSPNFGVGAVEISDRNGNKVYIDYEDVSYPLENGGFHAWPIKRIVSSDGREVRFNYGFNSPTDNPSGNPADNADRKVLKSITGAKGEVWSFSYELKLPATLGATTFKGGARALLTKIQSPEELSWSFTYYPYSANTSGYCQIPNNAAWALKDVTFASGGKIGYAYAELSGLSTYYCPLFNTGVGGGPRLSVKSLAVDNRTTYFANGAAEGLTTYQYKDTGTEIVSPSAFIVHAFEPDLPARGAYPTAGRSKFKELYALGPNRTKGALLEKDTHLWSSAGWNSSVPLLLAGGDQINFDGVGPETFTDWSGYLYKVTKTRASATYATTYEPNLLAQCVISDRIVLSETGERSRGLFTYTLKAFSSADTTKVFSSLTAVGNEIAFCKVDGETHVETGGTVGNVSRTFNAQARLNSETKFGVTNGYTYAANGDVNSITDPRGYITRYSNYYLGVPQTEKHAVSVLDPTNDPDVITISRVVNTAGEVTSETDGEGNVTGFTYDGVHRPKTVTLPRLAAGSAGKTISIAYAANSETITRGGHSITSTLDSFGRKTALNDGGIVSSMQYDAVGRKTYQSYPGKAQGQTFTYDALNRIKSIQQPHPESGQTAVTKSIAYADATNSYSVTNERGKVFTYTYAAHGHPDKGWLTKIGMPIATSDINISRHKTGKIASAVQGGVTRSFNYDDAINFNLLCEDHPELGRIKYVRDANGNVTAKEIGAGSAASFCGVNSGATTGLTQFDYDGQNRMKSTTYPAGGGSLNVAYTYYKNGLMKTATNSAAIRANEYNQNLKLTKETMTVGATAYSLLYGYDALDNLDSLTYPSGATITYAPDSKGRPTVATPYATSVSYFDSGILKSIGFQNGVTTANTENQRQLYKGMNTAKGGASLLDFAMVYDANGNATSITDALAAGGTNYARVLSYDDLDRLSTVKGGDLGGTDQTFAYDAVDNVKSISGGKNLAYTYDASNRLSSVAGNAVRAFGYDRYGNVTSNGTSSMTYDANFNMTSITGPRNAAFAYDSHQHRASETRNGNTKVFFYSKNGKLVGEYSGLLTSNFKETFYIGNTILASREKGGLPF